MAIDVTPPLRRGTTRVRSDRVIGWSEWGPLDGVPVLFSPGAATSSSLGFACSAAVRLGARLIALDRPGLGQSTVDPERSLLDFADDVRALADARSLGRPPIVGFSQGAPFALACGMGVASAVAIVSGTDELAAIRSLLPPELVRLVEQAMHDPAAADAFFRGMTPAMMLDMILASSRDVDLAVYRDPVFAAAFATALDEGFAQGPAGYARDTVLTMRSWPFELAAIRVPVQLWYGRLDGSVVHSPDHGASLAHRIPGATLRVVDDAGGALLWTHGEMILEALLACV